MNYDVIIIIINIIIIIIIRTPTIKMFKESNAMQVA